VILNDGVAESDSDGPCSTPPHERSKPLAPWAQRAIPPRTGNTKQKKLASGL